ncbi:MAG: ABC transporter ATP-binding protein, partial [Candidatus Poribacteria bacterium]|nr:ABC transporter ATP-binding protein [Candidatus Poribacteria bacterium]
PRVLFLDEPTGGLDPRSARLIKDLIPSLCGQGISIVMTTHILEIAERISDRVGILYNGELRACGTLAELRAEHGELSLEDLFLKLTDADATTLAPDLWQEP